MDRPSKSANRFLSGRRHNQCRLLSRRKLQGRQAWAQSSEKTKPCHRFWTWRIQRIQRHGRDCPVIVHTDGRLRPITLDNLIVQFKVTAPSKLYWADRPAMKIIQSLYWLKDAIRTSSPVDQYIIQIKLSRMLQDPQSKAIKDVLTTGMYTVPVWMQKWLKNLLTQSQHDSTRVAA